MTHWTSLRNAGFESKAFLAKLRVSSLGDSLDMRSSSLIPPEAMMSHVLSSAKTSGWIWYQISYDMLIVHQMYELIHRAKR
jgi:hypothetical protein